MCLSVWVYVDVYVFSNTKAGSTQRQAEVNLPTGVEADEKGEARREKQGWVHIIYFRVVINLNSLQRKREKEEDLYYYYKWDRKSEHLCSVPFAL